METEWRAPVSEPGYRLGAVRHRAHRVIVQRISTEHGSHIIPALDEAWPEIERLRWYAAVTELDVGCPVRISCEFPGPKYAVVVGSVSATLGFRDAWLYLTGVAAGACMRATLAR